MFMNSFNNEMYGKEDMIYKKGDWTLQLDRNNNIANILFKHYYILKKICNYLFNFN